MDHLVCVRAVRTLVNEIVTWTLLPDDDTECIRLGVHLQRSYITTNWIKTELTLDSENSIAKKATACLLIVKGFF